MIMFSPCCPCQNACSGLCVCLKIVNPYTNSNDTRWTVDFSLAGSGTAMPAAGYLCYTYATASSFLNQHPILLSGVPTICSATPTIDSICVTGVRSTGPSSLVTTGTAPGDCSDNVIYKCCDNICVTTNYFNNSAYTVQYLGITSSGTINFNYFKTPSLTVGNISAVTSGFCLFLQYPTYSESSGNLTTNIKIKMDPDIDYIGGNSCVAGYRQDLLPCSGYKCSCLSINPFTHCNEYNQVTSNTLSNGDVLIGGCPGEICHSGGGVLMQCRGKKPLSSTLYFTNTLGASLKSCESGCVIPLAFDYDYYQNAPTGFPTNGFVPRTRWVGCKNYVPPSSGVVVPFGCFVNVAINSTKFVIEYDNTSPYKLETYDYYQVQDCSYEYRCFSTFGGGGSCTCSGYTGADPSSAYPQAGIASTYRIIGTFCSPILLEVRERGFPFRTIGYITE